MSDFFQQPEQFGTENTQTTEAQGTEAPSTQASQPQSREGMTQAEIVALDKLERFKFGDREFTPETLRKSMMFQSDYTKKTQALKQVDGYYKNLQYDLDHVRDNPKLADKFKEIYPKEFWKFLNYVVKQEDKPQGQAAGQQTTQQQKFELPKEVQDRLNRVESYVKEKEVERFDAQIDSTFAKLSQKYPDGNEEIVLARAQAMLDQNPDMELNEAAWERLWKQSHEQIAGLIKKKQEAMFNAQKSANTKAKDIGAGGGTPGAAPVRVKFKDVQEQIIKDTLGR